MGDGGGIPWWDLKARLAARAQGEEGEDPTGGARLWYCPVGGAALVWLLEDPYWIWVHWRRTPEGARSGGCLIRAAGLKDCPDCRARRTVLRCGYVSALLRQEARRGAREYAWRLVVAELRPSCKPAFAGRSLAERLVLLTRPADGPMRAELQQATPAEVRPPLPDNRRPIDVLEVLHRCWPEVPGITDASREAAPELFGDEGGDDTGGES